MPPVLAGRLSTTEPPGELLTEAYSSTPVIEEAGVMVTNENILLVLFEEGTSQLAVASESLSVLGARDPCRSAFWAPFAVTNYNIVSPHDKSSLPLETVPPLTFWALWWWHCCPPPVRLLLIERWGLRIYLSILLQSFQFVFPDALGLEQWFSLPSMPLGRYLKTDSQALPPVCLFHWRGNWYFQQIPKK